MPKKIDIEKILSDQEDLFLKKLADYGTQDVLEMGLPGVIMRIREKQLRVLNLLQADQTVADESIEDTLMDIMGYSLIGLLLKKGQWVDKESPEPKQELLPTKEEDVILLQRTDEAQGFEIPFPKKDGDVGYDLTTCCNVNLPSDTSLPVDIPTGMRVKLPKGTWALVINRSSTPRKMGIEVVPGVIDNGYTGELFACCFNRTGKDIMIEKGTRLAQFILMPSIVKKVVEVEKLPETTRGETGFGSTGIK